MSFHVRSLKETRPLEAKKKSFVATVLRWAALASGPLLHQRIANALQQPDHPLAQHAEWMKQEGSQLRENFYQGLD